VIGHDDVSVDFELIFAACSFQRVLEEVAGLGCAEVGAVLVATEVDGVVVP